MKKKIYLSGKISGDPDFKEKFAQKERELTQQGYHVFNPAVHPDMFTWEQFMELDLMALANCDSIYLLNDWKDSRGAKMEYDQAVKLGKEILFENKNERVQNVLNDKSDQRLTVTYQESNKEKKIRVQLCEEKSWKYRVMLDDKSMTPWQYSDHEPKAEDYIDVKNFYTKQRKKNVPLTKNEEEFQKL